MRGYARSYKLRPCSVPDCPEPMGGSRKKPWLSPRRMSLSKFGDGLTGVACSTCFSRLDKRFRRGFPLFSAKQVQGPCFETAALLQMHERKLFLSIPLPVVNLPFTVNDLRGPALTAAIMHGFEALEMEDAAS